MPSQAETIQALRNANLPVDPTYSPNNPADPHRAAMMFGSALGIPDAIRALKGEMTEDEQKQFAMTAALGLIPGAEELGPAARAVEGAAAPAVRAVEQAAPSAARIGNELHGPEFFSSLEDELRSILGSSSPVSARQAPMLSDEDVIQALSRNPGASIFDIASVPQQQARSQVAAPSIIKPQQGILGGTDRARQLFAQHIAPYVDEATFANQYFNGMHQLAPDPASPNGMNFSHDPTAGNLFGWDGGLMRDGRRVGTMTRGIDPDAQTAYHGYLKFYGPEQAKGNAKQLLRNQVDIYNKMGLKGVELTANIDIGGYAWAKYGFMPDQEEWSNLQLGLRPALNRMQRNGLDPATAAQAGYLINDPDPRAIWSLSDITAKSPEGSTVGKDLLAGTGWHGKLDLTDPESMERFNAYVTPGQ